MGQQNKIEGATFRAALMLLIKLLILEAWQLPTMSCEWKITDIQAIFFVISSPIFLKDKLFPIKWAAAVSELG